MRELGYVQGRDFDIVYRFAEGYSEQLPTLAAEVVRLHPAVVLAASSGPAVAAKKATAWDWSPAKPGRGAMSRG